MRIFDIGKTKPSRPKTRRRKTKAEKRREWAEEQLMARAKTDSRAESAMILKETGVNIPPIDESKIEEKKLGAKITQMALEEINSNEELKKRATARKIESILGDAPPDGYGGEDHYYPTDGPRSLLDTIREYRELEQEFGSGTGNGTFGFLKDPGVINQLLIILGRLLPTAGSINDSDGKTVVVELDGRLVEMPLAAYETYRSQREQLLLAESKMNQLPDGNNLEMPSEEPSDVSVTPVGGQTGDNSDEAGIAVFVADKQPDTDEVPTEGIKSEEVNIQEFLTFAEEIATAMEGTPQQFAEELAGSAEEGNQDAKMLLLFLSTVTYDKITELVKPYEQIEGLTPYIAKLLENKEWIEEALAKIKEPAH